MENTQLGFGGLEREQTEQDVLLASFAPIATRPDVYLPPYIGTIEMQGKQPSCGSHSGQAVKQILGNFRGSPEYLWKKIKLFDGISLDSGTTMECIFKSLKNTGICSSDLMPNNVDVSLTDYADPATITSEMDSNASLNKTGVYAFTFNPTWEQLKQAIYDHKAVIMLLRVGSEWWIPSWLEKDILPLRATVPISSGHFVTAYGYDENYIYFENHWSDKWGRNGIGYFGQNYMSRCVEIGTTVNVDAKYIFTKVLKIGSRGFDVKQLQTKLGVTSDGIFGMITKETVMNFQRKNNLTVDGIVGQNTNKILNSIV
jgi:peptidoglycan hydrolase-like protein with peptidoglycan-binding domain